jgi:hypothetical protein
MAEQTCASCSVPRTTKKPGCSATSSGRRSISRSRSGLYVEFGNVAEQAMNLLLSCIAEGCECQT